MQDQPQAVYITLQKENQLPYSIHADFIPEIKRYQVFANLNNLLTHKINGEYKMTLHIEDPRIESYTKDLGSLTIDFNEGSHERVYDGVRDDYKMYDTITNYFPPEPEPMAPVIPMAFSGLMVFALLMFISSMFSNGANVGKLSVGGLLFILNFLAIYGVIVAFWIEINLVNTLWILAAAALPTLFTMHIGLPDCEVKKYKRPKKD